MASPQPSIPQAATFAWGDTVAVLRALAAQAWIAFAISVAVALLQRFTATSENAFVTGVLLAGFIIAAAQAFLLTPYLIAIHRFIILGEVTRGYQLAPATHRFQLFLLWSLVLSMFYWVPAFIAALSVTVTVPPILAAVLVLAVVVAAVIASSRLIVLFPAIAVDAPGATWTNAMADTKGRVWRILFISLLAALPALVIMFVVLLLTGETWALVSALFEGAANVLLMTLAIAVSSRLYEQLGDRVNRAD